MMQVCLVEERWSQQKYCTRKVLSNNQVATQPTNNLAKLK